MPNFVILCTPNCSYYYLHIIFTMVNSTPKFSIKLKKRFGNFSNMRFPCDVYARVISVRFKWIELWWSRQFVYLEIDICVWDLFWGRNKTSSKSCFWKITTIPNNNNHNSWIHYCKAIAFTKAYFYNMKKYFHNIGTYQ